MACSDGRSPAILRPTHTRWPCESWGVGGTGSQSQPNPGGQCVGGWGPTPRLPKVPPGADPGPSPPPRSVSQEILFYKVIDYILHGKEDIKVIP